MKYFIRLNYLMDDIEFEGTLDEAKEYADDCAAYNQQDVKIYDEDEDFVTMRKWYGAGDPSECQNPICFGTFGFYDDWSDEQDW